MSRILTRNDLFHTSYKQKEMKCLRRLGMWLNICDNQGRDKYNPVLKCLLSWQYPIH